MFPTEILTLCTKRVCQYTMSTRVQAYIACVYPHSFFYWRIFLLSFFVVYVQEVVRTCCGSGRPHLVYNCKEKTGLQVLAIILLHPSLHMEASLTKCLIGLSSCAKRSGTCALTRVPFSVYSYICNKHKGMIIIWVVCINKKKPSKIGRSSTYSFFHHSNLVYGA